MARDRFQLCSLCLATVLAAAGGVAKAGDGVDFLAPAAPAPRTLVAEPRLQFRFQLPLSRSASHGPWFVQLKLGRGPCELPLASTLPHRQGGSITIGVEF
ncbi:MAG: hypothetical protein V4508_19280 [Pseudomonadota bacterium]